MANRYKDPGINNFTPAARTFVASALTFEVERQVHHQFSSMNSTPAASRGILSGLRSRQRKIGFVSQKKGPPVLMASALAASHVGAGSATVLVDELDAGRLGEWPLRSRGIIGFVSQKTTLAVIPLRPWRLSKAYTWSATVLVYELDTALARRQPASLASSCRRKLDAPIPSFDLAFGAERPPRPRFFQ